MAAQTPNQEKPTKTVIIIDDSQFMRQKLKQIVLGLGYTVLAEGETGVDAVKLFAEHSPDLITLDIVMPLMNGVVALTAIKKAAPTARVIMISSFGEETYVRLAALAGAENFILKPFDEKQVALVLQASLGPN